jgi:hypothetical protein
MWVGDQAVGPVASRSPSSAGLRGRGDAGAGLVGLLGGVLIFLIFLLFACHLLIGLYARSVVAGAAFDGAQYLARHDGQAGAGAGAFQTVQTQLASAPGLRAGPTTPVGDTDHVEYTVEIDAPRILSKQWVPGMPDTIRRTARVRIERRR